MKSTIKAIYHRLLQNTNYKTHRYLFENFSIDNRLTGIVGPRGTGKTTLILQYINEKIEDKSKCIYVSLDNIYFSKNNLYEFITELYETEAIKTYFLDEVHKYKNWNQELKNIYDSFPDIHIVFSGSSSINLIKGTYDLSRRGIIFRIHGMSFREYLCFILYRHIPTLNFNEVLEPNNKKQQAIAAIPKLRGYFKDYLEKGYYPFIFEDELNYHQRIMNVLEKIIYEDISYYYNLKTNNLINFKKILSFLATIPPGDVSINRISKNIAIDNKTITNYVHILNETGLIRRININKSGSSLLKSKEKIFLENTNLYTAITNEIGYKTSIGTIRELFFINMVQNAGKHIYYSDIGDYEIDGMYFEIGGKKKKKNQIKNYLKSSYIVKDDILYGEKRVIPLYLFGFLY